MAGAVAFAGMDEFAGVVDDGAFAGCLLASAVDSLPAANGSSIDDGDVEAVTSRRPAATSKSCWIIVAMTWRDSPMSLR